MPIANCVIVERMRMSQSASLSIIRAVVTLCAIILIIYQLISILMSYEDVENYSPIPCPNVGY